MVSAPPPITLVEGRGEGGGGGLNLRICQIFVVTKFFLTFVAG